MSFTMATANFDQQSQSFLDWFKSLPGATFRDDIIITDLRHRQAGRGIVATADIDPDTVLFKIPRKSILCAKTSELVAQIPDVFAEDLALDEDEDDESEDRNQDPWSTLILIMLREYLRGDQSPWKPYFDVLPSEFDTPMFWTEAEVQELQASSVVSRIGRDQVSQMIGSKILPVIRAHEDAFFPAGTERLGDEAIAALAHRMGSTIMAYAFDLETDEDDEANQNEDDEWVEDREGRVMMGMVPMADILNADAEFNAHINHEEDALTATALRPIRAGEEILNYYGPLSNGELLRRYGYVTETHARYDVVELPWDLVEKRVKEALSVEQATWEKLVSGQSIDPEDLEDGFVIERQSEDPDATGRVYDKPVFAGLPEELVEQVKAFLKAARKAAPELGLDDKNKREAVYLESVLKSLRDRAAQYATSLEQDEQLLAEGRVEGRARMAVLVRRGEKLLLRDAQSWVQTKIDELQGSRAENGEPSAKRRRAT
ncbi:SET domain-containing protein [Thozetella sp. PMI_491]|nr:SET domain-containing protein [Thozetella sp. PMI_491]